MSNFGVASSTSSAMGHKKLASCTSCCIKFMCNLTAKTWTFFGNKESGPGTVYGHYENMTKFKACDKKNSGIRQNMKIYRQY